MKEGSTMTTRKRMRRGVVGVAIAAAAAIALAGCGAGGGGSTGGLTKDGFVQQLNFGGFGGGENPKANFNPFLPTSRLAGYDYMYEPLMVTNGYTCEAEPWLATAYEFTDPQTLVFTLRDGMTWTDGEALTAADVAFTFNMIKQFEVLDEQGVWRYLQSVEATDDATVVFHFSSPGASALTLINNVRIVPEHVWAEVDDPVTFVNAEDPVSSGPMTVKSFTPQALVMERNPDFWGADTVKVQEIKYNKSDAGQVEQLKLARGDYDQNAQFIPNIEDVYIKKDPEHNHYWFPASTAISLFMNLEKQPFDDLEFRKAMSLAIDRDRIITEAQFDYVEPASQTNLVLPGMDEFLPADLQGDKAYVQYDEQAAADVLDAAGYELDGDRRLGLDGKPLEMTFKVPGGYSDWVQATAIIQENLDDLGITLDVQTPTPETVESDRALGEYDMVFGVRGGSCNMFRNFQEPLASDQTAPTGEKAATNEVRWRDARTDELIDQLRVATDDAEVKEITGELSHIMVEQVPFVPIWYGANWFQYSTKQVTGWPSEDDPYSKPGDNLLVLTHLEPVAQG